MAYGLMELGDDDRVISSSVWRELCAVRGAKPSSATWSLWRKQCGVTPPAKTSHLTRQEAFLLWVRSRLNTVCSECGLNRPVSASLTLEAISLIASTWLERIGMEGVLSRLEQAANASTLDSAGLLEVVERYTGKYRSHRTMNRRLSAVGLPVIDRRRNNSYSPADVRCYVTALSTN